MTTNTIPWSKFSNAYSAEMSDFKSQGHVTLPDGTPTNINTWKEIRDGENEIMEWTLTIGAMVYHIYND